MEKTKLEIELNEIFSEHDYISEDEVNDDIIFALAELCQEPYLEECSKDEELSDYYHNDDEVYYDGLSFRDDVLANIIDYDLDDALFDVDDFDYSLIEKIAERSNQIFNENIEEFYPEDEPGDYTVMEISNYGYGDKIIAENVSFRSAKNIAIRLDLEGWKMWEENSHPHNYTFVILDSEGIEVGSAHKGEIMKPF